MDFETQARLHAARVARVVFLLYAGHALLFLLVFATTMALFNRVLFLLNARYAPRFLFVLFAALALLAAVLALIIGIKYSRRLLTHRKLINFSCPSCGQGSLTIKVPLGQLPSYQCSGCGFVYTVNDHRFRSSGGPSCAGDFDGDFDGDGDSFWDLFDFDFDFDD